jgi:hypothetical protein
MSDCYNDTQCDSTSVCTQLHGCKLSEIKTPTVSLVIAVGALLLIIGLYTVISKNISPKFPFLQTTGGKGGLALLFLLLLIGDVVVVYFKVIKPWTNSVPPTGCPDGNFWETNGVCGSCEEGTVLDLTTKPPSCKIDPGSICGDTGGPCGTSSVCIDGSCCPNSQAGKVPSASGPTGTTTQVCCPVGQCVVDGACKSCTECGVCPKGNCMSNGCCPPDEQGIDWMTKKMICCATGSTPCQGKTGDPICCSSQGMSCNNGVCQELCGTGFCDLTKQQCYNDSKCVDNPSCLIFNSDSVYPEPQAGELLCASVPDKLCSDVTDTDIGDTRWCYSTPGACNYRTLSFQASPDAATGCAENACDNMKNLCGAFKTNWDNKTCKIYLDCDKIPGDDCQKKIQGLTTTTLPVCSGVVPPTCLGGTAIPNRCCEDGTIVPITSQDGQKCWPGNRKSVCPPGWEIKSGASECTALISTVMDDVPTGSTRGWSLPAKDHFAIVYQDSYDSPAYLFSATDTSILMIAATDILSHITSDPAGNRIWDANTIDHKYFWVSENKTTLSTRPQSKLYNEYYSNDCLSCSGESRGSFEKCDGGSRDQVWTMQNYGYNRYTIYSQNCYHQTGINNWSTMNASSPYSDYNTQPIAVPVKDLTLFATFLIEQSTLTGTSLGESNPTSKNKLFEGGGGSKTPSNNNKWWIAGGTGVVLILVASISVYYYRRQKK